MYTGNVMEAKDRLVTDFSAIIEDAEKLLQATAGQAGDQVVAARARVQASLKAAKQEITAVEALAAGKVKAANNYVHEHPWLEREKGFASAYYWAGRACMGITNYFEAFRQLHRHEVLLGYDETSNQARYDKYRKAVEQDPGDPSRAYWTTLIEELKPNQTNDSMPYLWAARYIRVGEKEQALKWLNNALEQRAVVVRLGGTARVGAAIEGFAQRGVVCVGEHWEHRGRLQGEAPTSDAFLLGALPGGRAR